MARAGAHLLWGAGGPIRARKIPQFQAVYRLTGTFEAPIYRAHAARWPWSCGRCSVSGKMKVRLEAGLFDIVI